MIKAVLDTNIFVGAFLVKNGFASRIIKNSNFQIIISEYILEELRDVLVRLKGKKKYNYNNDDIERYIRNIRNISYIVSDEIEISALNHRDPDDNMILACALEGNVDYIVSRDKDLLSVHPFRGIDIIIPEDFYNILIKSLS